MLSDCEQLALDGKWDLARRNACHIGVMNSEMGDVRSEIVKIKMELIGINGKQTLILFIFGAIAIAVIGVLIQKAVYVRRNGKK